MRKQTGKGEKTLNLRLHHSLSASACLASDAKPIDDPSEGASPIYLPCYNFHTNVFISKICQDHACQVCANASHGKGNCLRFTWPVDATIGEFGRDDLDVVTRLTIRAPSGCVIAA